MSRTAMTKKISDQIINAYTMALQEHSYRIGGATLSLDDVTNTDAEKEASIDSKAVNDPDVLVYLGPMLSSVARVAIPNLCKAQIAIVSSLATYPGLTKQTPYNGPGEPDAYYPNCARNFARVVPTDDAQGAAGAQFAKQLGVQRVYVLHDSGVYGQAIAAVFAATATRIGLQVVGGPEGRDPSESDYSALGAKVRQARPDMVYFGGIQANHAGKLWQDLRAALGYDVKLMGADGIADDAFLDAAGSAAEGTFATFAGVPAPKLTGKGADWFDRYQHEFHEVPQPYVANAYEAMNVALDAIARVGTKDRAAIRDAILSTTNYTGVLGTWSFTPTGDTTLSTMTVRQVHQGAWDPDSVRVIEAP